ncbi:MAG TPA: aminoglycoside phosphotransferase family protein [Gemmatimonadaceae bacterium]|nr:aminoglycoside phosphotransferase family protein [Gemmatimonadaceae bacterium]
MVASAHDRLRRYARQWRVALDEPFETASSLIAYGRRGAQPVVLKVVKRPGDEWESGRVAGEFGRSGIVRVYECDGGAMLLERIRPGNALVDLALSGRDEEATAILARTIQALSSTQAISLSPARPVAGCPTVGDWGRAFDWYLASGDRQVPGAMVREAQRHYTQLSASQGSQRLLHGDLQHSNILFDTLRGWVAIDPKGVIGEVEYEVGAALRNPREDSSLFTDPTTIRRRVHQFTSMLQLDSARVLRWAFAQAVLSAIWEIEDGAHVDTTHPSLVLAEVIRPML